VYEDRKIGPRHAEMLKAFSDVTALRRFFEAPNLLWSKALAPIRAGTKLQIRHAALARSALILRIVQRVCPMRRSNIARLRIAGENPHIQLPIGPGVGTLYLPANEMKNLRAVHVRIDADTVEMIREFIDVFRPISMKHAKAHAENEHLFPGGCGICKERGPDNGYSEGFGYFTLSKLNNTFKKHLGKHSMINVDLQVMRHLAGKIILDQDPSAMGLVQEILAHKKIETTRAYYAEVCGLVAQARYLDLLDKATRKALANVSFKIQIEKELV
jgi:integrase